MKRFFTLLAVILSLLGASVVHARDSDEEFTAETQEELAPIVHETPPPDTYATARVLDVTEQGEIVAPDEVVLPYQHLKVEILSGPEQGTQVEFKHGGEIRIDEKQLLNAGETFVLGKTTKVNGITSYYVADQYRFTALAWIVVLFAVLVALIAGRRGITAFLGLLVTILVLGWFMMPRILAGQDPLGVTLVGSAFIMLTSLYLAHGFNIRTTLALASSILTLLVATGLALATVHLAQLTGTGTEDAYNLQFGQTALIDLRGLLLSGILIGVIGVLDDVTTAQVAAVAELRAANQSLGLWELYRRALNIGREHILSLVNTLVLAYAGTSLPVFIFFLVNQSLPTWVLLNSELIAEEVVRTLVGSTALVLAVPIATFIGAWYFSAHAARHDHASHGHHH